MEQFFTASFGFVVLAASLDIVANLALAKSNGFHKLGWGILALVLVMAAFTALSFALHGMELPIAYASWGVIGILGTAVGGWLLLDQKLKPVSWVGILLLIISVVLMKTA
ncbi:SMR family transporter [Parasalinivibrio latis]|uniref:SMR family transporter n=1 Tax=Parasalinivibrio latis TaxID=2952610 RepID=UPI0006D21FAB